MDSRCQPLSNTKAADGDVFWTFLSRFAPPHKDVIRRRSGLRDLIEGALGCGKRMCVRFKTFQDRQLTDQGRLYVYTQIVHTTVRTYVLYVGTYIDIYEVHKYEYEHLNIRKHAGHVSKCTTL